MCKKSRPVDLRDSRHGSGVQRSLKGCWEISPWVERSDTRGLSTLCLSHPVRGARTV
jgi:hypothetical protein